MRIPRKKKKQIPVGLYCYTGIKFDINTGVYHIKTCPFFTHIKVKDIPVENRPRWMDEEYLHEFGEKNESWCKLVKTDIMDQCKSCGLKYGKFYK
jgi:hypothetical protein